MDNTPALVLILAPPSLRASWAPVPPLAHSSRFMIGSAGSLFGSGCEVTVSGTSPRCLHVCGLNTLQLLLDPIILKDMFNKESFMSPIAKRTVDFYHKPSPNRAQIWRTPKATQPIDGSL
ncbi:hypothetical protein C8J57DRAFT_1243913 [Mycena rebaudengoi]|nr:hypothetical protein C8J57DRAFT_1243913 [Mycena rebaudengoi]